MAFQRYSLTNISDSSTVGKKNPSRQTLFLPKRATSICTPIAAWYRRHCTHHSEPKCKDRFGINVKGKSPLHVRPESFTYIYQALRNKKCPVYVTIQLDTKKVQVKHAPRFTAHARLLSLVNDKTILKCCPM